MELSTLIEKLATSKRLLDAHNRPAVMVKVQTELTPTVRNIDRVELAVDVHGNIDVLLVPRWME